MAINLSKNDRALVASVFKLTKISKIDAVKVATEVGITKAQLPQRAFSLRAKLKSGSVAFSTNDEALLVAVFKLSNIGGDDSAKVAGEIGIKKSQLPGRMFSLRKKLGVGLIKQGGPAVKPAAVASEPDKKTTARDPKSKEEDQSKTDQEVTELDNTVEHLLNIPEAMTSDGMDVKAGVPRSEDAEMHKDENDDEGEAVYSQNAVAFQGEDMMEDPMLESDTGEDYYDDDEEC